MADFLALLSRISQALFVPSLIGLLAITLIIGAIRNWRITLPALLLNYAAASLLLASAVDPLFSLLKVGAGGVAIFVLSIAAQRADTLRALRGESVAVERLVRPNVRALSSQLLLRAAIALLIISVAFGAAARFPLPDESRALSLAAYALLGVSVLLIATAPEALNVGVGLLMFLSGFELAYLPLEPSLGVSVLMALITLFSGLAVAYVTQADVAVMEEEPAVNLDELVIAADEGAIVPVDQPEVT